MLIISFMILLLLFIIFSFWAQVLTRRLEALVLGTETHPTTVDATQEKFDERKRKAVMLIKLLVIDDQLSQVLSGKIVAKIWTTLKDLHKTLDKSKALLSIITDKHF